MYLYPGAKNRAPPIRPLDHSLQNLGRVSYRYVSSPFVPLLLHVKKGGTGAWDVVKIAKHCRSAVYTLPGMVETQSIIKHLLADPLSRSETHAGSSECSTRQKRVPTFMRLTVQQRELAIKWQTCTQQ